MMEQEVSSDHCGERLEDPCLLYTKPVYPPRDHRLDGLLQFFPAL